MKSERAWMRALAEHRDVVAGFRRLVEKIPDSAWQRPTSDGKWSPAAVALHLIQSYELGRDGALGNASMQMRASPRMAWVSRTFLLPLIIATKRFPRGVKAPREVRPDVEKVAALDIADAMTRFTRVADEAGSELHGASRATPRLRVQHAYFGPIDMYQALKVLSAHTRHHTRMLTQAL